MKFLIITTKRPQDKTAEQLKIPVNQTAVSTYNLANELWKVRNINKILKNG